MNLTYLCSGFTNKIPSCVVINLTLNAYFPDKWNINKIILHQSNIFINLEIP